AFSRRDSTHCDRICSAVSLFTGWSVSIVMYGGGAVTISATYLDITPTAVSRHPAESSGPTPRGESSDDLYRICNTSAVMSTDPSRYRLFSPKPSTVTAHGGNTRMNIG